MRRAWVTIGIVLVMLGMFFQQRRMSSNRPKSMAQTLTTPSDQQTIEDLEAERSFLKRVSRASSGRADVLAVTTTSVPPTTSTTSTTAKQSSRLHTQSVRPITSGANVWPALANCESTMNQRATSANGLYLGYFQFSLSTWHSVGGPGDPRDSDYATQLKYAQILQARSGWGQWPVCSKKLGLR